MKLIKTRILGFQAFKDSGDIHFEAGINLIIGQNNAGKSSLIRALLLNLPNDKHKDEYAWEYWQLTEPKVFMTFQTSGAEISELTLRSDAAIQIPTPPHVEDEQKVNFISDFLSRTEVDVTLLNSPGTEFKAVSYPSHDLFQFTDGESYHVNMAPRNGSIYKNLSTGGADTLPILFSHSWSQDMFHFKAERLSIGSCRASIDIKLNSDASNLPVILHTMSTKKPAQFQKLISHLHEIIPTVENITVPYKSQSQTFEILTWPSHRADDDNLAFPLDSGGTGVAQIIALLTAIITTKAAIIIIDEVNSFLHPSAIKSLIRIIRNYYNHHQYIITTHSPDVISQSGASTIHLVKRSGYTSEVHQITTNSISALREVGDHLGVSMSDVFSADSVLWVEGETEELCFPYIYSEFYGMLPTGTIISTVSTMGDFNTRKRDARLVYDVYTRLCSAVATLPVKVMFSFDREVLSDSDMERMSKQSRNNIHFLKRRHLECYLLNVDAILAFVVSKCADLNEALTSEIVGRKIEEAAQLPKFMVPNWQGKISDVQWLEQVDAANIIKHVCAELSDQRCPFNKKEDSHFLLRHIIENSKSAAEPLAMYVRNLIDSLAA